MNKQEKLVFDANVMRIRELEKKLAEMQKSNQKLNRDIESKNNAIASMKLLSKEKDARIKELGSKTKSQEKMIGEQNQIIAIQENAIAEKDRTIATQQGIIDEAKRYLIEQKIMETKLVNQLFGTASAKTKNLVRAELKKSASGQTPAEKPKKEKEKNAGKRGRKQGTQNFQDWKQGCFLSEEALIGWLKERIGQACPACGEGHMVVVGYDTVEKISLVPARLKRTIYRFPILQCPNCGEKVRTYEDPDCFGMSACTPSLAGFLSMLSCGLFLPYKRIEDFFGYAGTPISRELVARYIMKTAELLKDFVEGPFRNGLMKAGVLHLDETVCCNLEETDHTDNRIWGATTGKHDKIQGTFYRYSHDRKYINLLGGTDEDGIEHKGLISPDFAGTIVTDDYGAYMKDYRHCLCWSHLRKKLYDYLMANGNPDSQDYKDVRKLFDSVNAVFAKDRTFDSLTPEERLAKRQKELKPLIEAYFELAESIYDPEKDDLKNKSINYGLKKKELYMTLIDDADAPLTNNRAEVSMRKVVMRRVASMFSQSTEGMEAFCILLSLVQSARMNRLQPDAYIDHLLENLDVLKDDRTAEEFLPWSENIADEVKLTERQVREAAAETDKELKAEKEEKK